MLEPKDLLIVNSTVIAGLLILLTIQSYSGEIRPLEDWNNLQREIRTLENEQYALNKTIHTLNNETKFIESETRLNDFQKQLDELSTRYVEITFKLEHMGNREFRVLSNGDDISLDELISRPTFSALVKTYGVIMIFPFAASSAIIISATMIKQEEKQRIQRQIRAAKTLSALGFIAIIVELAILDSFYKLFF